MPDKKTTTAANPPVVDNMEASTVITPNKRVGLWVFLAIVLIGVIAGAYYYLMKNNDNVQPQDNAVVETSNDPVADELSTLSDSNDAATIKSEISDTDLSDVDTELDNVEADLSNL